jgi:SnoaL-like domain
VTRENAAGMSSPFKAAVEAKDPDAMAAVLRPDVVFRSPAVYKPYQGREAVLGVLTLVVEVFEEFRYTGHLREGDEEVLRFSARVGDRELEGVDLVRYDDAGLVSELAVMVRPHLGLVALLKAMGARLAAEAG